MDTFFPYIYLMRQSSLINPRTVIRNWFHYDTFKLFFDNFSPIASNYREKNLLKSLNITDHEKKYLLIPLREKIWQGSSNKNNIKSKRNWGIIKSYSLGFFFSYYTVLALFVKKKKKNCLEKIWIFGIPNIEFSNIIIWRERSIIGNGRLITKSIGYQGSL